MNRYYMFIHSKLIDDQCYWITCNVYLVRWSPAQRFKICRVERTEIQQRVRAQVNCRNERGDRI